MTSVSKVVLTTIGLALVVMAALVVRYAWMLRVRGGPPAPIATVQGYEDALRASPYPADRALLQHIIDGPGALKQEKAAAMAAGVPLSLSSLPVPFDTTRKFVRMQWIKQTTLNGKTTRSSFSGMITLPEEAQTMASSRDNPIAAGIMAQAMTQMQVSSGFDTRRPAGGLVLYSTDGAPQQVASRAYALAREGRYIDAIALDTQDIAMERKMDSHPFMTPLRPLLPISDVSLSSLQEICAMAGPNRAVDSDVESAASQLVPSSSVESAFSSNLPDEIITMEQLRSSTPGELSAMFAERNWVEGQSSRRAAIRERSFSGSEQQFVSDMVDAAEAALIGRARALAGASSSQAFVRRAEYDRISESHDQLSKAVNVDYSALITDYALSLDDPIAKHECRLYAEKELTLAAGAILAYKAKSGQYPLALRGNFIDPYDGQKLSYRREGGGGFVVYSVGESGLFDGGKPGDMIAPNELCFRYPSQNPVTSDPGSAATLAGQNLRALKAVQN